MKLKQIMLELYKGLKSFAQILCEINRSVQAWEIITVINTIYPLASRKANMSSMNVASDNMLLSHYQIQDPGQTRVYPSNGIK